MTEVDVERLEKACEECMDCLYNLAFVTTKSLILINVVDQQVELTNVLSLYIVITKRYMTLIGICFIM